MKRMICTLLALVLALVTALSCTAAAVDPAETGKTVVEYGDWILRKIDGDTRWELNEYNGSDEIIYTPRIIDGLLVTAFGDHSFATNATVKTVYTGSPLSTVGNYAFIDCTALEKFECSSALKTIGAGAFSGTASLTDINLEDSSITAVSNYAFTGSGLIAVELPDSCLSIGESAFVRCTALTKIIIPDSVTEIADTAFENDESLVIYCNTDSYAHTYAEAHDIDYVLMDAPVEVTFMLGDADGDGKITILDATKIQRLLASLVTDEDGMIALRGDSDEDGLNILDATRVQRYLASLNITATVGETVTREIVLTP